MRQAIAGQLSASGSKSAPVARSAPAAKPAAKPAAATRVARAAASAAVEAAAPPQIDAEFWQALGGDPGEQMEAILVSAEGLETLLAGLPDEVTVAHKYRLINAVSVRATAAAIRGLVRLPMIKRIEAVRPVAACEPAAS